jgi:O-antigen/teichoic acid export membrane protein
MQDEPMMERSFPFALMQRLKWLCENFIQKHQTLHLTMLDQAIVSGVNFVTGILLAKVMGVEAYGLFTLLWMAILFINSFQIAFIISPMMSIAPKQGPAQEPGYYGAVWAQQFIFCAVSTIALALGLLGASWFLKQPGWGALLGPLIAVSVAFQMQEFIRRYFFTRKTAQDALINDSISYLGQLIVLVLLSQQSVLTVERLLWVIAITSLIAFLVGLPSIGSVSFRWTDFQEVFKRHLHFSKWLAASNLMTWLSGNLLLIVAGATLGTMAVGILKSCQNIIAVTHILFNALGNIVPVRAGRILAMNHLPDMERYLKKVALFGFSATALLALPALLIPDQLLQLMYGPKLGGQGAILMIYAILYLIMFCNQILTMALRTLEITSPIFIGYCLTALISVAIAYPLCQFAGTIGVVCGSVLLAAINGTVLGLAYWQGRQNYCPAKEDS